MKINDILKESVLKEFAVTSDEIVNSLIQAAEETDPMTPEHQEVMKAITMLLDKIKAGQAAPQPEPQPVQQQPQQQPKPAPAPAQPAPAQPAPQQNAPMAMPGMPKPVNESLTDEEQAKIEELRKLQDDPQLDNLDENTLRYLLLIVDKAKDAGREEEFQTNLLWNDELQKKAEALADKVVNNAEIIHQVIEFNKKKDGKTEEQALAEEFETHLDEAKAKAAGKKKAETGEVMKDKIIDLVRVIFERPVKSARDRATTEAMRRSVVSFMEKSRSEGIVDFIKILRNKKVDAKIDDMVAGTDRSIYNLIKNEAFNATPGTTAGAWGPGEVGLSILANPVTKGTDGGDLRVLTKQGPVEIELKGMKSGTSGGRFNSNGVAKATDAGRQFKPVVQEFFNDLWALQQGNARIKKPADLDKTMTKTFTKPPTATGKARAKPVKNYLTFDLEALNDFWNPKLIVPASRAFPRETKAACKKFLEGMARAAILDSGIQFAEAAIKEMIRDPNVFYKSDSGGFGLAHRGIQANICKILYSVYAGVDNKGVIMYFNTVTTNYYVARGPDDMKEQVMAGKLRTGNAIIDFAAGQSPASPQVGID